MARADMVRNNPTSRPDLPNTIWRWPKNRDYSHALARVIGESAFGGGEIEEIELAVKDSRAGNPDRWYQSWNNLGEGLEGIARSAEQNGDLVTARDAYLRASNYYRLADLFLYPDDERRLELRNPYGMSVGSFDRACRYLDFPVEKVQISFEEGSLPAYLFLAKKNGRSPAVVFLNDFETTKEEQFFAFARAAVSRGISTLCVDGPGQGEALRARGMKATMASESFVPACFDFLSKRSEIDSGKIGLMGWGLGSYWALRAAANDKRFGFCFVWSALVDLQAVFDSLYRLLSRESIVNLLFAMGFSDMREAREKLKGMRLLEDTVAQIKCPVFILHGREDTFLGVEQAEALHDMLTTQKDLVIVEPEWGVGGVLHNQVDNLHVAHQIIFPRIMKEFGVAAPKERMAA